MKEKDIYVVAGCGRVGTSLIAKILDSEQVNFGNVYKEIAESDTGFREAGYMENKMLSHASGFYKLASGIQSGFFLNNRIKGLIMKMGDRLLRKSIKNCNALKVPSFTPYIGNLKKIGYNPIVICIWREPMPNLISIFKQDLSTNYQNVFKMWIERNENLLFFLSVFDGCLIKFEDVIENRNGWSKVLSKATNLQENIILDNYKKYCKKRKHNISEDELSDIDLIVLRHKLQEVTNEK